MKEQNQTNSTPLSMSKSRKLARKEEIARTKRIQKRKKLAFISTIVILGISATTYMGYQLYFEKTKIAESSDYSKYLADNGFIQDIAATSYVDLADYNNITVPSSEIEYSEESLEEDVTNTLDAYKTLDTNETLTVKDGDTINIDYVGYVDGVAFDGGNTEGAGADLEIGSGTYIDDFEDQLIGSKVGDEVTVEVTFPDDYSDTTLAGQDAVFEVVINGIYTTPELTDAFVKKNLSDYATTAEGYINYLKETNEDLNLTTWLETYLVENSSITSYPEEYLTNLAATMKYDDSQSYKNINEYLTSFGSDYQYDSFEDYIGMSKYAYEKDITERAQSQAKEDLIYQAILEKEGIELTESDYMEYLEESNQSTEDYQEEVEVYGTGYVHQELVKAKAIELIKSLVVIE